MAGVPNCRFTHGVDARSVGAMTSRTALVTGANQGLGRALVAGLAARLRPTDRVLLTGRDPERVRAAAAALPTTGARVEGRVLDVRDPDAITALAAELGEVDIVFSNATSRMSPDADPAAEVDAVAETNNLATSACCGRSPHDAARRPVDHRRQRARHARQARRAGPRPVRGGRHEPRRRRRARRTSGAPPSRPGGAEFGTWLNIPSKVAPGRRRARDRPRAPGRGPRARASSSPRSAPA